jgi:superfamily II DNA/RNA helicase
LHCRHFLERQLDVGVESLHGDKDQAERTISMKKFSKSEETAILVATDIASRGLDVKDIRTVVNYDVAKNIETYVHRIGRTGQRRK